MKRILTLATIVLAVLSLAAQNSVTVTFTCRTTDSLYVPPDYIVVENLDRGWTENIYFPDTVYKFNLLAVVDLPDYSESFGLVVSPNPFEGATTLYCNLPATGKVALAVTDLTGRTIVTGRAEVPQPDRYAFRISLPRPGVYLASLRQAGKTATTKLVSTGCGKEAVEFVGLAKESSEPEQTKSSTKSHPHHLFQLGDQMRYVAYASDNPSHDTVLFQYGSDTLTLLFNHFVELGDSLPCPGTPTVTDYDGNVYSTVKIGNQCWMRENLRVTHYADGTEIPLGGELASFTEPFYYNHPIGNLTFEERGYLYNGTALMNGESYTYDVNPPLIQGVCPDGWHVPAIVEWGELISYLSDQSEYCCGIQNHTGKSLAAKTSWPESPYYCCVGHYPSTNNATGFTAFSTGYCVGSEFDNSGAFFASTAPYAYRLSFNSPAFYSFYFFDGTHLGLSVRCLKD